MDETAELFRAIVEGADEDVTVTTYAYTWTSWPNHEPSTYTKIAVWAGGTDHDHANDRVDRLPAELDPGDYPTFRAALIAALDGAAQAAGWEPGTGYIVLCGQAWMNEHGSGINYDWDRRTFGTRRAAIDHGFTLGRSDDFNIGTVVGGKLAAIGWMEKDHDTAADRLAEISKELYIEAAS